MMPTLIPDEIVQLQTGIVIMLNTMDKVILDCSWPGGMISF